MADRFPLIIDNSAEKIKELVSGDNLDLTKSNLKNADHIQSAGVNVAGVATATSLIGDGSQLTNLPGGGGNTLEATASGTLADGSKVIVNADGTVSVVTQTETTGAGVESNTVFHSDATYGISAVYDSSNNKVIIAYNDYNNSQYGTAVVGTVSGTSISFGSPTIFNSNGTTQSISATFDSNSNKVVIAYLDRGNPTYGTAGTAIVGTVSGTSISFGSPALFNTANTSSVSTTFDSTNNKVVIAYCDYGDNQYGKAIVGTVSGTGISFGSETTFNPGSTNQFTSSTFDSSNGKVVIVYKDNGNGAYGTAIVGTVSGTSISFGSESVFNAGNTGLVKVGYDSTNNKVIVAFQDIPNSDRGRAIVGTVSGTSISFGTPDTFTPNYTNNFELTFDSAVGKVVIGYRDAGNSNYGTLKVVTVSGTSISFGSAIIFESAGVQNISPIYDSVNNKIVVAYHDQGNSNYGTVAVVTQTGFPVPSVGSATVFESFAAHNIASIFDSTNGKVIIAYQDRTSYLDYGTAVVGTVSGTSISFGTPVTFESATTSKIKLAYDSANQKVVIAYRDNGNSQYGTAIVGTVSGTSISFGSPTVYQNSGALSYNSITYDSSNQKVVVAYKNPSSGYGVAKVGTVSGTSISFGSESTFNSGDSRYISSVYDSANQKVVIAYRDNGNSNYGTAVVGTVSGTSISFGTEVVFESATTQYISTVFDSANDKVVIVYQDSGNSGYGTAIVGTVSGTSISFGSAVAFESNGVYVISPAYDSFSSKVVIAYQDYNNSYYATAIVGTVSGTSISFDSPIQFASTIQEHISATYDSTNDKVVISFNDRANSEYGTAFAFNPRTISRNLTAENFIGISDGAYSDGQTATIQIMGAVDDAQSSLTPGQSYYVQNDGTLSTSADTPSVFAGTAIAATKLIVRG